MFELPEITTLAIQMNDSLAGKVIAEAVQGNSPHKFVWYNHPAEEFAELCRGKVIGNASSKGRWLFLPLDPGYIFVLGEFGGKVLFHTEETSVPVKYHLLFRFTDGTALTAMTQMWGAVELYEKGKELERQYIKGMRPTPSDPEFTFPYFSGLIDELLLGEKRSVKSLLTQDQLIPGLGNAIAQDILFRAKLHPRYSLIELDTSQKKALFETISSTVRDVIAGGGRNDEYDLYNQPGRYQRIMDKRAEGNPCPDCGSKVEKNQYLGGACYFCPNCQK
jgi:formamidopyrimidine-DNA glycosylase